MKIDKIALYGAGLIGSGWATHLLLKGVTNLVIYDLDDDKTASSKKMIQDNLSFIVREKVITSEQKDALLETLSFTTDTEAAVKNADLIIENGPENLQIKRSIIAAVETYCRPDAIITSSTSGILIDEIAKDALYPQRIIGVHPYHPVYLLPLVEILKGKKLEEKYLNTALDFLRSIDKKPVVLLKESPGYIASHLMFALWRETLHLATEGIATLKDIDDAFLYGPGLRYGLLGIHMVYQLAGGVGGIQGFVDSPLFSSGEKWLKSLANWETFPPEVYDYLNTAQNQINEIFAENDQYHGRNNLEISDFRDRGLIKLLQHHQLI